MLDDAAPWAVLVGVNVLVSAGMRGPLGRQAAVLRWGEDGARARLANVVAQRTDGQRGLAGTAKRGRSGRSDALEVVQRVLADSRLRGREVPWDRVFCAS
ncbi:hypothetical protein [Thauera sp. SDU_THAU2]|uniref:hypothetical protein n=1 Tax=Thauera sp. SDU_THAU2 TaxID=3136633 RepID=UPI00311E9856